MVSTLSGLTQEEQAAAAEVSAVNGIAVDKSEGIFLLWKRAEYKAFILCRSFSIPDEVLTETFPQVNLKEVEMLLTYHPIARDVYQKWSIKLKQFDGPNAHSRLLPLALMTQEACLRSPKIKETDRLRIATEVIDRVKGKPKQTIETANLHINADSTVEANAARIGVVSDRINALMEQRNLILKAKQEAEDAD